MDYTPMSTVPKKAVKKAVKQGMQNEELINIG